jgi:signal transduction histidine kinase
MARRVATTTVAVRGRPYRVTVAAPMGAAYDALSRFGWLLGVLLPSLLLLAGVGGYWVIRRALTPVGDMTRTVQGVTLHNLDARRAVPVADDELRRLATTFNDMLGRLQAAVTDIVRFTIEASHELRTPVSLVRTTAEFALRRERTPEEYRQARTDVLEQAQHMSVLVADLLTLARAGAGIEPRDVETVDLGPLVADSLREMQHAADGRSVTLHLHLPDRPLIVDGEPGSLRRLLLILLDNAVRYSRVGGAVHVRVKGEPAGGVDRPAFAVLEVLDEGVGVEAADLPHVFEQFYRGSAARQQVPDGSGLGLSIARTIVERHGGTISVESGAGGDDRAARGCHVQVRLPVA